MEIVLERIAKKNTYTIGRLYLLADGDVKRKVLSGKTAGDKRSFVHSFDLEKLQKNLKMQKNLLSGQKLQVLKGITMSVTTGF